MSDSRAAIALDEHCLSDLNPWNVADVSAANAQFAGVLAGFMILALTTLLTIKRDSSSHFQFGVRHATALLGLGIIILGADAYLFGSIAATQPPKVNDKFPSADSVCQMAWVQFMPAAGLLALGAAVLVAGLSWMIVCHSEAGEVYQIAERTNWAIAFVALGGVAFLTYDALTFIDEMGISDVISPEWRTSMRWITGVFVGLLVVYYLSIPLCTNKHLRKLRAVGTRTETLSNQDGTTNHYDPRGDVRDSVGLATGAVSIYLLGAFAFTLAAGWFYRAHHWAWLDYCFYLLGILICVIGPAIVLLLIALGSPGMHDAHLMAAKAMPSSPRVQLPPATVDQSPPPAGKASNRTGVAALGFAAGCLVGRRFGG
nr:hypothetical protein [Mycobacterium gordonae]